MALVAGAAAGIMERAGTMAGETVPTDSCTSSGTDQLGVVLYTQTAPFMQYLLQLCLSSLYVSAALFTSSQSLLLELIIF